MNSQLAQWVAQKVDLSPTPYHAVEQVKLELLAQGFCELYEAEEWQLNPNGRYFVTRRNASIVAFTCGDGDFVQTGFRVIGAHTDSPVLKVKPNPEKDSCGYKLLGVEVYGGALLAPWFDRDLSLAGKVTVLSETGVLDRLVDFEDPIAFIPRLAIHLDRNANDGAAINPQEHMNPILGQQDQSEFSLKQILSDRLKAKGEEVLATDIADFDLCFYDTQKSGFVGLQKEFIACARLDNLLSCFVGVHAFSQACNQASSIPSILALFDHEEVGSCSDVGARSNFLLSIIERLIPDTEKRYRALRGSCIFSVDNAHGIHPNYKNRHDEQHGPILNSGPVLKYDANQGYATSSQSSSFVKYLAKQANIPLQAYVTRADMRCGSTIGPMSAAATGINTVDIGVPTFAMHSCRELAGSKDIDHLSLLLSQYLKTRNLSL